MKNQKAYIKQKIKSLTSFSYDTVNEATEKVLELIQKNIELGKINHANQDVIDFLIYRVVEKYY